MKRLAWIVTAIALLALAACGPKMDDLETGETGRVAAVSDGDTLTLDNGLRVQLTGIIAPRRGFGERKDEPKANEARQTLEKLTLGREARLGYGGEKRFRETTALAQLFVKTEGGRWIWVQDAMVREGMARARSWKDNYARHERLYASEAVARREKRGLWGERAYAVRDAAKIKPDEDGFHIVEGVVLSAGKLDTRTYLNFGEDYRTDFTVMVVDKDYPNWKKSDVALDTLAGKRVRVRGYVRNRGGPLIQVDHPQAIEILKPAAR
jgi:endonuclease YncB( thermonuclease family)